MAKLHGIGNAWPHLRPKAAGSCIHDTNSYHQVKVSEWKRESYTQVFSPLRKEQITAYLMYGMDDASYERLKGELNEIHERLERVHLAFDDLERKFPSR